jgi:hypothetical protein
MRAKFKITSVRRFEHGEELEFFAVPKSGTYPEDGSDENNTYAKYTPSANCKILITNPALYDTFKPGEEYYVDFTKVQ